MRPKVASTRSTRTARAPSRSSVTWTQMAGAGRYSNGDMTGQRTSIAIGLTIKLDLGTWKASSGKGTIGYTA